MVKIVGLILLVPSVFAGLLPLLADHSTLIDSWPDVSFHYGATNLLAIRHTVNGTADVHASALLWIVAAVGELMLIGIYFLMPKADNRFLLKVHG